MSIINYDSFTLDNGLHVLVHEDHSVAKAVVDVIYNVGAKDEDESRTGFAHLFEHLMFGGSRNIPEYDTPLQKVGGENNAFTSNDITNYYLSVPSNQIETGFWLESDRMLELDFSQEILDVQKSVVIEEFKQRYLNRPYGDAHLLLREVHFTDHPYKWATIGKEIEHISGASLEEVKEFFFSYYAPNNATLVVAGDVTLEQVKALAEKWFGPIPRREVKKKTLPQEPRQNEARSKTVYKDVPFAGVYKMYHIPAKKDKGYFAADLLTDILSAGRASRLYQYMVKEKQVASSVRAFSWGAHDPGMISIDGTVARGKTVEEYETALNEVLADLMNVTEDELQRVKNSIETQYVLERTTILNKAMILAISDILGNPELANTSMASYMEVSLDELKSAASEYLRDTNCSTLYYLPKDANA